MGIDDSINLSEAPALLFAKVWSRVVSLKAGEEQALQALDHPDPAIMVHYRRQFLEANRNDSERRRAALAKEEAYALISELISNLRNLGAEGRIIASGLYAGTGQHQLIPAELWPAAKIDFGAGRLRSGGYVYDFVTVQRVTEPVETITKKMSARLLERRAQQGDESKKVLRAAIGEEFGKEFTTRAFNDAYSACYERTRGRPKKRK
jgi:hypothetical protein